LPGAVLVVSAGSLSPSGLINLRGFVIAVVRMLRLGHREFTADVRLLPRNALRTSSPLYGLYLVMTLLIIGLGCELFVPYLLQHLHGQTPLAAGYITAAAAAGWTLSEVASSGWTGRRADNAIVFGPLILAAGLLLLLFTVPVAFGMPWLNISGVVLGLTLAGFGIGLGWPHLLTRVLQQAPEEDREKAGASITVVQSFAAALGAALAGTVANFAGVNQGDAGASSAAFWMFLLFAIPAFLAMWIAWRSVKARQSQRATQKPLSRDLSQG